MGLVVIFYSPAAIGLQDRLLMWFFCPNQVSTTSICNALSILEQEKVSPSFQVLAGILTWWLGGVGVEGEAPSFLLKLDPKRVARTDDSILLFHLKLNQKGSRGLTIAGGCSCVSGLGLLLLPQLELDADNGKAGSEMLAAAVPALLGVGDGLINLQVLP